LSVAATVRAISPFTTICNESTGVIESASAFTWTVFGAVAATAISSPGLWPSTSMKMSGPVDVNVRPRRTASSHERTDNGPSISANVRSEPGGGSRQTSEKLSVPPVAGSSKPALSK
jgi:hypothetical protein